MTTRRVFKPHDSPSKKCVGCGLHFFEEQLSKRKLCYQCAKKRMIANFERMWSSGERSR